MAKARDMFESQERDPVEDQEINQLEEEIDILQSCKMSHGVNRQISNKITRLRFKIKVRNEKRCYDERVKNLVDSVNVFAHVLEADLSEKEKQELIQATKVEQSSDNFYQMVYDHLDLNSAFQAIFDT